MFKIVSSLKKVETFSSNHNMGAWNIWESMFDIVVRFKDSLLTGEEPMKMPLVAIQSAIGACYFGLLWDKQQVTAFVSTIFLQRKYVCKTNNFS